jgi:Zn-dependent protease
VATTFLNGGYSRAVPIVSSFFTVKDVQLNVREDYAEFLIAEAEVKDKFPSLLKELGRVGMIATAKRSRFFWKSMPTLTSAIKLPISESVVISVFKVQKQKAKDKRRLPMPFIFFVVTVAIVFLDGYIKAGSDFAKTYVSDLFLMAAIYTMSLMGILGIHELGHMIALKHYNIKASWPYFIPGYPGLIPTFGALITQRGNMTNRNVMFDVGIAGPIAGLIITIIVSIYGSTISTLISLEEYQRLHDENQIFDFNTSLLMMSTLYLTDKVVDGMVLVMSPVLFAAWIGFALTAINLFPAWQLDGGHIARAALGERWHKIVTYAGIGALAVVGFWPMALLVFLLSQRIPGSPPLDDVSPLSPRRKILFFVALGLAVICAPIPTTLTPWS